MRRALLGGLSLLAPLQCSAMLLQPTHRHLAAVSRMVPHHHALAMAAEGLEALDFDSTRLYPQPPLVADGMLKVSDLHTIAWFEYGNRAGKPVLFVHGGPGGGTAPMNARYFDPEAYRIVLVDQRGCGKSLPFAELEENTTGDLVEDFEKVRKTLGIDTWQVFGGSWGSTLALSYAIAHPERVTELVLRGIFLLRHKELEFCAPGRGSNRSPAEPRSIFALRPSLRLRPRIGPVYEGKGTNFLFPEQWEAYKAAIPEAEHAGGFIAAYGRRLRGELGDDEKFAASKAWSVWEGSVSRLTVPSREAILKKARAANLSLTDPDPDYLPGPDPDPNAPKKVGGRRLRARVRAHREPLLHWARRRARLLPARGLAARGGEPRQEYAHLGGGTSDPCGPADPIGESATHAFGPASGQSATSPPSSFRAATTSSAPPPRRTSCTRGCPTARCT